MNDLETEKYFRDMNALLRSEGWKHLLEEVEQTIESVNTIEFTKDVNDLYFRKGQLAVLANLLNLELRIKNAEEEFENAGTE